MRVHLSGRWEFRVRPCEALNELGYAGRNRHELLESFDVPPLLASAQRRLAGAAVGSEALATLALDLVQSGSAP
eukprot:s11559_g1.t1